MKKLVVTGSNSELAKLFLKRYGNKFDVTTISTHKEKGSKHIKNSIILDYKNLKLYSAVKGADFILHYAWSRNNFNNKENLRLINYILQNKKHDGIIYFISSASASNKSLSLYGKQKFEISEIISNNKQVNIILGLPKGNHSYQYKLLSKALNFLPFSLRFSKDFINIYSIDLNKFNEHLYQIITSKIVNKTIFLVEEIKSINDFFSEVQVKKNIKIIFPAWLFTSILKLLSIVNYKIIKITKKQGNLDKLLTFFSKDDNYLSRFL